MSRDDGKREKSHREKKNYRGHLDYLKRKKARNDARPKQMLVDVEMTRVHCPDGTIDIEVHGGRWIR